MTQNGETGELARRRPKVRFGRWHMHLPHSQRWRIAIGVMFIVGGLLGFLPVLGFWMIPVGLLVLSVDSPFVRRRRRRIEIWWGRRQAARAARRAQAKVS